MRRVHDVALWTVSIRRAGQEAEPIYAQGPPPGQMLERLKIVRSAESDASDVGQYGGPPRARQQQARSDTAPVAWSELVRSFQEYLGGGSDSGPCQSVCQESRLCEFRPACKF